MDIAATTTNLVANNSNGMWKEGKVRPETESQQDDENPCRDVFAPWLQQRVKEMINEMNRERDRIYTLRMRNAILLDQLAMVLDDNDLDDDDAYLNKEIEDDVKSRGDPMETEERN